MTDWERSLVTCALQIAVISTLALILLGVLCRRPRLDRLALCRWAYAGLMLFCIQAAIRPWINNCSPWPGTTNTLAAKSVGPLGSPPAETVATADHPGITIPWSAWRASSRRLWEAIGADVAQSAWPRWRLFAMVPMTGLLTLAGIRFGLALWWLHHLRRSSIPIREEALHAELAALQQYYGLQTQIAVRETSALSQAAVIGWWQPVLLLPVTFRDWSVEELRLVLAHELAHVKENDFRWRLVAEIVRVLHAYQPLVHALHYRLMLEQELAADQAAAGLCGGSAAYLRTLSKLALRSDIRSERTTFAPVLTGHLFRRIEMLQAKDGRAVSAHQGWSGWIRSGFATVIALLCGLNIPAGAEGPAAADAPQSRVEGTGRGSPPRMPAGTFARPVAEPLFIPQTRGGLVELHLHELFNGPSAKLLTLENRRAFLEELTFDLESMIGKEANTEIGRLRKSIEQDQVASLSTDLSLQIEHHPEHMQGERNLMGFQAQSLRIHLREKHDWNRELQTASIEPLKFRDVPYWSAQTPVPLPEKSSTLQWCVAYPDPQTQVIVFGQEELEHAFPETLKPMPEKLRRMRQAVAGGVFTLVLPGTAIKVNGLDKSADPRDAIISKLAPQIDMLALGIDLAPDNQLAIRVRFGCATLAQAQEAELALQSLFEIGRTYLAEARIIKVSGNQQREVDGGVTFFREMLAHMQLRIESQPDGTADVVFDTFGSRWFEAQ